MTIFLYVTLFLSLCLLADSIIYVVYSFNKLAAHAKEQLETGGAGYEEMRRHHKGIKLEYILPEDTEKCAVCHINPATKMNALGERTCVQC